MIDLESLKERALEQKKFSNMMYMRVDKVIEILEALDEAKSILICGIDIEWNHPSDEKEWFNKYFTEEAK